ncbi:hypothetical protein BC833DRAFT_611151 [Globomyces pollinis-pini]|nr:hypothetical protein BC833DRAFT_611151 [Globomyces pollinis-pini]
MYSPNHFEPVKLDSITRTFLTITSFILNLGVLANAILLYIFFRNYHSSTTIYEKCIGFLILAELFWALPYAIENPYMLIKGESFGFEQCQWNGPILPIVSGMTIFAHGILAIDRYFTIILQIVMKPKHFLMICSIYVPAFCFLTFSPLFIGTGYALNDHHYCYYNFKSRNVADLVIIGVMFVTFYSLFGIIVYCYANIYRVISTGQKLSDVKKDSTRDRLNKKIFFTCITVVGCFAGCYTPIMTIYSLQTLFNYDFPSIINYISTTLGISDTCFTPICLFLLIPSYQQGFRKHIYDYRHVHLSSNIQKPTVKTIEQST